MDSPKTFPLRVMDSWLRKVEKAQKKSGAPSMHQFIVDAVNEKIAEVTTGEQK